MTKNYNLLTMDKLTTNLLEHFKRCFVGASDIIIRRFVNYAFTDNVTRHSSPHLRRRIPLVMRVQTGCSSDHHHTVRGSWPQEDSRCRASILHPCSYPPGRSTWPGPWRCPRQQAWLGRTSLCSTSHRSSSR